MNWALDYLGGAKYSDLIIKEHPAGWGAGFFTNTFGDALPVIRRLLATGRCPSVRLHLNWRDDHRFSEADINPAVREAKRVLALTSEFPNVTFYISPWCEHGANLGLASKIRDAVMPVIQGKAHYVNTPMPSGAVVPGVINEFHGADRRPRTSENYIFSFDGTNAFDADIESYKKNYSKAHLFFLWGPRMNGNWNMKGKLPRPERKGWPDSRSIDSLIYLHRPKGRTSLPRNYMLKSHAENHGPNAQGHPDQKGDKLMMIVPVRAREIQLRAKNGQVVDSLKYYGTYTDGRFRYYSTQWAYQVAEKARRIQRGDMVLDVVINGKKVGRVNPAFRENEYRV